MKSQGNDRIKLPHRLISGDFLKQLQVGVNRMSCLNTGSENCSKFANLLDADPVKVLSPSEKDILKKAELLSDPIQRWKQLASLLTPQHSWDIHRHLYSSNYADANVAPIWSPSERHILSSNIGKIMAEKGMKLYSEFYQWSIDFPEEFWDACIRKIGVTFDVPHKSVFDSTSTEHGVKSVEYLSGAYLNIATSCFNKRSKTDTAIVYASEGDPTLVNFTFEDLDKLTNRIANALVSPVSENGGLGLAYGDAVGICMPMSVEAVAVYLGVIKAGCAVVSIADSFSAQEIETRMKLSNAKAIFTQDVVYRQSKYLDLFARVLRSQQLTENGATPYVAKVVVIPGQGVAVHESVAAVMRPGLDFDYHSFLGDCSDSFTAVSCPANHICNILFSSGTTGEPKAIPWTHATPIKCAVDGYLHQDIQCGDVVAWPTNLGWMMGPWLLFQLINGATIALFGGVTSTAAFCKFVEHAKVSMLGVVPSLVKAWQAGDCTKDCDWSCVTKFSSSGEASDATAMQWLSSRAMYKPIIEYCGGTEVAGSYLSSTMVQHNVPSMFSTPVLGSNFIILCDQGKVATQGEIALIPPAMGLSTRLLNRNHHDCYYLDMPAGPNGEVLRRHGDEIQTVSWSSHDYASCGRRMSHEFHYYRALGRCDDTMNIGGIKVSSVEIERVCNLVDGVSETAAIGVSPANGGPSQLILFVILKTPPQPENASADELASLKASVKAKTQNAIKADLNPLFHIGDIVLSDKLPRTASNKIMRRILRDDYVKARDAVAATAAGAKK